MHEDIFRHKDSAFRRNYLPLDVKLFNEQILLPLRNLNAEYKNVLPTAKIIMNGNYLPEIEDPTDLGLRERLRNVPFTETFTGDRADPLLHKKLSTPESLSAMLGILVAAAKDWYRDGLLESKAMKDAKREYIADNDFISEFIDEFCKRGTNLFISRKDFIGKIRRVYEKECFRLFGNNDRTLADAVRRLDGIDYRKGGKDHLYAFFGIGWQDTPEQQSFEDLQGEPVSSKDAVPDFDIGQFAD